MRYVVVCVFCRSQNRNELYNRIGSDNFRRYTHIFTDNRIAWSDPSHFTIQVENISSSDKVFFCFVFLFQWYFVLNRTEFDWIYFRKRSRQHEMVVPSSTPLVLNVVRRILLLLISCSPSIERSKKMKNKKNYNWTHAKWLAIPIAMWIASRFILCTYSWHNIAVV